MTGDGWRVPGSEGLATGGGNGDYFFEFRLDRVVARECMVEDGVTVYMVYFDGGLEAGVTKEVYDAVGNYLHSLFPGETEGEVVIR